MLMNTVQQLEQRQQQEPFDEKKTYPRNEIAYKDGGIHNSKVKTGFQASVLANFVKQISSKLLKGEISNMQELSKPVKLCTHYNMAEILAFDSLNTHFLDLAAEYTQKNDPINRIKCIAAYIVSNASEVTKKTYMKVFMDPSQAGETMQMEKKDSKTQFYSENVQSRPPVNICLLQSQDKSWVYNLKHEIVASLDMPKMNTMRATNNGQKYFSFREQDGTYTQIVADSVKQIIEGVLMGERLTKNTGELKIIDQKNNLVCKLSFDYVKKSTMTKLTGFFKSSKKEEVKPVEYFECEIFKVNSFDTVETQKEDYLSNSVAKGFGNYVEFFQMDGKLLWKQDDKQEQWSNVTDVKQLLKSDSTYRDSVTLLQMEDFDNSEKCKVAEEKQELTDKKLRQNAREQSKSKGISVLEKQVLKK